MKITMFLPLTDIQSRTTQPLYVNWSCILHKCTYLTSAEARAGISFHYLYVLGESKFLYLNVSAKDTIENQPSLERRKSIMCVPTYSYVHI